jgi:hypothetical protein
MTYADWVALCASDPARANAICAERMGYKRDGNWWAMPNGCVRHIPSGEWSPITSRDHAAMMATAIPDEKRYDFLAHIVRLYYEPEEVKSEDHYTEYGWAAAALYAPPSLISYCACVALETA